jgi:hypothetical protein
MLDMEIAERRGFPIHTTAAQGQLVLIDSAGQPGASNRPALTALANRQPDTTRTPNRRAAAAAAAPIASTASPNRVDAAAGNEASTATVTASAVNAARTASARERIRRSQPRTVDTARPNRSAIRRWPNPAALSASAEPITSTASARRTSASTGNST